LSNPTLDWHVPRPKSPRIEKFALKGLATEKKGPKKIWGHLMTSGKPVNVQEKSTDS